MIAKETLRFLTDLQKNNNKTWFEANRHRFEEAKNNFESFVTELITAISTFDKDISELQAKNCTFRQYRDVRFSKDKTPYKVHMGAYFNKGGKKINTAGYYIHLEPGKSIIAAGLWMPESIPLSKVRQEIDYNFEEWESILHSRSLKIAFPQGLSKTEILKRAPKNYEDNNPAIEVLKLKSYVITNPISDAGLQSPAIKKQVVKSFEAVKPLIDFLNRAIS